jgi:FMN-dependent NADH-azoreductase
MNTSNPTTASSPATLPHLDASPRSARSQSRRLGEQFLAEWRAVLGFIGITEVKFVYAHSLNRGNPAGPAAVVEAQAAVTQLARAA